MDLRLFLFAVCVGIGATLLTDGWNLFLRYGFNIQSLDFVFRDVGYIISIDYFSFLSETQCLLRETPCN